MGLTPKRGNAVGGKKMTTTPNQARKNRKMRNPRGSEDEPQKNRSKVSTMQRSEDL